MDAFQWVDAVNGEVPHMAVQGGMESDGKPLFVGRGEYKGGLQVGKVAPEHGGLLIGYSGREFKLKKYQVLCGDAMNLRWVQCSGAAMPANWTAVEAGREADGRPLFVAKAHFDGGQQIGKAAPHLSEGMSFAFGSKEIQSPNYSVLVYMQ